MWGTKFKKKLVLIFDTALKIFNEKYLVFSLFLKILRDFNVVMSICTGFQTVDAVCLKEQVSNIFVFVR